MCAGVELSLRRITLLSLILASTAGLAHGQALNCRWQTVDDGGGLLAGGIYTLNGTVGQPDAGTASGGGYALNGGFWRGARALSSRLIFADGFATGNTSAWSLVVPLDTASVVALPAEAAATEAEDAAEAVAAREDSGVVPAASADPGPGSGWTSSARPSTPRGAFAADTAPVTR
jgi:hypothetical protein